MSVVTKILRGDEKFCVAEYYKLYYKKIGSI